MDNGAAVTVRDLRKSYRDVAAVRGIDLEIAKGEVFALLGPNGAGKTTTVEILEGFRHRDQGTIDVLGQDPARASRGWRARIGIVLQLASAGPELTVLEMVRHFAAFYPRPRRPEEAIELDGAVADRQAVRRPDPQAGRRAGHRRTPRAALPRRADHGFRPGGPPPVLGPDQDPARRRHDDPADHPLPGRGGSAGRPDRGHRGGPHRGRG